MQCGDVTGHLDVQCPASTVEVCCSWVSISEALSAVRCFTSKTFYVAYIVEALSQCVIHFAKQVAVQVRSLLKGEKSLPKYDRRQEGAIKEYEEIVRKMRTVQSEYVTVCFPSRPLESTPNTTFSNEGSQSQNPYRS